MSKLALALTALAISVPLGAQTPLAVGRPVRGTVARGDTARYTVEADSAMVIRFTLDQTAGNTRIRLRGPKNDLLRTVDETPTGMERLQYETPLKGTYQLQVVSADSASDQFTLTLTTREVLSSDPVRFTEQLLAPWDRRDGPGAEVAVWRNGRTLYAKAFGMANLTYDVPFTLTTPTNIGSTSKQFTAFAIMLLVDDGKVSLDDDIRKFFPELPDFGKTVKVRHLLTHTTGFREFLNSYAAAGRQLGEGDFISRDEVLGVVLRQPRLQNDPGAEFNYNNTSFAMLAMLVERVAKQPFQAFMAQRAFGPLGMTQTSVRFDRHGIMRGASAGYVRWPDGRWRDVGDLAGAMGAGGIYTTVGDLQKWAENLLSPKVGSAAGVKLMMTPNVLTNGKSTDYGLGLFVDKQQGVTRVHHGGADIAHRSMLAIYPDLNAGVTVQSNDAGFNSNIAFRIAGAFFPELKAKPAVAGAQKFDPATYDPKKFDAFVGRYAMDVDKSLVLTFRRSGDSLTAQLTGQQAFPLYPTSDTTFALRVVQASFIFERNAQGKATGVILMQGGANHATRLPDDAAVAAAWKPAAQELAAYSGRYFSEEAEAFYEVRMAGDTLMIEGRRIGKAPLTPTKKDAFTVGGDLGGLGVEFERDRNGRVSGFYVNAGRSRDIRFARER